MRKYMTIGIACAAVLLGGCGAAATVQQAESVKSEESKAEAALVRTDQVDIDMDEMSSTMVFAEASNMVQDPVAYDGKIVKLTGTLAAYQGANTTYYSCILEDALACCSQGIEFEADEQEEYPSAGSTVTIVGRFEADAETINFKLVNAKFL